MPSPTRYFTTLSLHNATIAATAFSESARRSLFWEIADAVMWQQVMWLVNSDSDQECILHFIVIKGYWSCFISSLFSLQLFSSALGCNSSSRFLCNELGRSFGNRDVICDHSFQRNQFMGRRYCFGILFPEILALVGRSAWKEGASLKETLELPSVIGELIL